MNDKDKAEVMLASHEGKRIEFKGFDEDNDMWGVVEIPTWNWPIYNYRVALKKPEPLELWVNLFDEGHTAYPSKEVAKQAADPHQCQRTAVHIREVEAVEPLEADKIHKVNARVGVRKSTAGSEPICIAALDEEVMLRQDEIPALITVLRGLTEGGSK